MNDSATARYQLPTRWIACLLTPLVIAGFVQPAEADPVSLELVQTIPLKGAAGRLDHLALDANGNRLFIANLSNNSLDVVDLKAGKLVKQIPNQQKIQGVAYVSDVDRIFVGNGQDGVCNVFDGKSYELVRSIKLDDADNVRYDPRTGQVYVTHAENALSVIDPKKMEVKATIKLPGAPEAFQLDPFQPRLYVNIPRPSQVAVVDTDKNEVVDKFPLTLAGANYPLALDPKGGRVFVGCRNKPTVVVLDAKTGKEVVGVEIPGDIDDLFFDAKRERLYAACGAGFLAVLQRKAADHYEVVERIATGRLTRTCLFDPESGRLYLPVPRQEGKDSPELRVFQAKP
jgi:DNA-binding beta-propeller fold protein YncE